MELERLKNSRKGKKSALTREINTAVKFAEAGIKDEIEQRLERIKLKFGAFEAAHEEYHDALTEEEAIEESNAYFDNTQDQYITAIKRIGDCQNVITASSDRKAESSEDSKSQTNSDRQENESQKREICTSDLLSLINLPKLEIEPYDGDPMRYHSFIATFDENVGLTSLDPRVKLSRLMQYTCGRAKEAIRSCTLIGGEDGYLEARAILEKRFGNHHVISDHVIKRLKNGPLVNCANDLVIFSDEINNCMTILNKLKRLHEVDTQSYIVAIVDGRLQSYLKNRWRRYAMDVKREKDMYPSFKDLVDFICREAEDASDPVYGQRQTTRKTFEQKTGKNSSSFHTTTTKNSSGKTIVPCILCSELHRLFYCQVFKDMKPAERLNVVRTHKLCENCLLNNHVVADCKKPTLCSVPGCNAKHTKFVHISPPSSNRWTSDKVREVSNNQIKVANKGDDSIFVPIVSVVVNRTCNALALLDTASNSSFCTRDLIQTLGIQGKIVNYMLNTMSRSCESKCAPMVNLTLTSNDGETKLRLCNVYVVDDIPVNFPSVDLFCYPHLADLRFESNVSRVQILIGQDHSEALLPLEIRKGNKGEPFAIKTMFGWSVNGPAISSTCVSKRVINNFIATSIDADLKQLWELEDESIPKQEKGWSQCDKQVVDFWDKNVRIVNGHYELPLPWKENVHVPNNVKVAESRLKSLTVTLKRKNLFDKYDAEVKALLAKGYAEPVPLYDCSSDKIWYLPHHGVMSDNKPGKIRVVYDCASRFENESLNEKCNQGPNFNNQLSHVLLRFRQHEFAAMADIEAMYYQVVVPVTDRNSLRFLWYDEGQVKHYRMTRHVFGGVWSGSAAMYALRRVVGDYGGENDLVDGIVLNSFYVDDCLKSFDSRSEAINALRGVTALLGKGGFRLTKFVSNDDKILKEIPEDDRATGITNLGFKANNKALGVRWDLEEDVFYFEMHVDFKGPVTRRNMLSTVASMFDPLGFLAPVLIIGRMIFQEATRLKLKWDEQVSPMLQEKWIMWLQSLQNLPDIKIQRCVKPGSFNDAFLELHYFSDASESGYGSCAYLRCVNKQGNIHTALLFSKGKVAPMKTVSIPRLELQAAVLSARMDSMLRRALDLELADSYFWVDSKIALSYIKNDTRRFHVYVSNRVSEIRQLTDPAQWHHISGKDNPADLISRGHNIIDLEKSRWFNGPKFLTDFKSDWSSAAVDINVLMCDPEVNAESSRADKSFVGVTDAKLHPIDKLVDHYSSWTKMKRALVWWLRFKKTLTTKGMSIHGRLSLQELKTAEVMILAHVQQQMYSKEISQLKSGQPAGKSSALRDLTPFMNADGLLCVGGRISQARLHKDQKHPIIISDKHVIADKIVREIHNEAHLGTEWTLSLLRVKYWVIRARVVIKRIIRFCVRCKRLNASPEVQQMSDLPAERLQPDLPPFSHVGLDCFGPFMVKYGRAQAKRYGLILTCFTTRAIHLEVLHSMDTDSFLNGFRRFVSRRGVPKKLWSDNGTNFVGGCTELAKGMRELQQSVLHQFCLHKEIEWVFNTPHASHHGGIWERLIRIVRKVFTSLFLDSKQRLTDDILHTVFCEAEMIVNSRPITKVSSDADDLSPLTPNHLLLLREGPTVPPGVFSETDMYRQKWRYVQHLSNCFWRRWMTEYVPELQRRQKWHNKRNNVKEHDLVIICDEATPRGLWPLGIVVEAKRSSDGLVRSVKVKTRSTILVRPVTKIVNLECE